MKRLYMMALVFVLLLTQWGSLAHDYHIHDTAETCDYCLSAQALDNGVTAKIKNVFDFSFFKFQSEQGLVIASRKAFYYYSVRAPPLFF